MQCCQTNVVGCTFFDTLNIRFEQLTTLFINVARNLKMYDTILKMYDTILKMYDINLKMYDINPLMYRRNLNAYGRNLKMYSIYLKMYWRNLNEYVRYLNEVAKNLNRVGNILNINNKRLIAWAISLLFFDFFYIRFYYNLGLLNFMPLTWSYCGLLAPKTDLTYFLTSLADS